MAVLTRTAISNNPLQFTCPVCDCHELVLVETHVVHYTVVRICAFGELEYQPTPFYVENDGNIQDGYFACAGYCPGYPDGHGHGNCHFIPNYPDNDLYDYPDDDPNKRIADNYTMLE